MESGKSAVLHNMIKKLRHRGLVGPAIAILGLAVAMSAQVVGPCKSDLSNNTYYIEHQSKSPVAIRDLSAVFVNNKADTMAYQKVRVTFTAENRSKKKVVSFQWDDFEPGSTYEGATGGANFQDLLPGQTRDHDITFIRDAGTFIFRITDVEFSDKSKWSAPPRPVMKNLSERICVSTIEQVDQGEKRSILSSGWRVPVISDRAVRNIPGEAVTISGIRIQTIIVETKPERLDVIGNCAESNIIIDVDDEMDYDTKDYVVYSRHGKPFAYRVNYEVVEQKGQYLIGAGSYSIFVDKVGNGSFSIQCTEDAQPILPVWVQQLPN